MQCLPTLTNVLKSGQFYVKSGLSPFEINVFSNASRIIQIAGKIGEGLNGRGWDIRFFWRDEREWYAIE